MTLFELRTLLGMHKLIEYGLRLINILNMDIVFQLRQSCILEEQEATHDCEIQHWS